jgi:hypothetical protein
MILTVIAAAAVLLSPVQDYCPMEAGTRWTFEDGNGLQLVEEIGEAVDIGKGQMAIPKVRKVSGRSGSAELYRVDGDTLRLVGFLEKASPQDTVTLLKEAQSILRVADGKAEWQYVGEIPTGLGPVLVQVHGESKKGPKRKVLDREVETLLVHVSSRIGNDRSRVEVKSDAVYAKGIGLVEMNEVTKAEGQTVKKMLKLVKFEKQQG